VMGHICPLGVKGLNDTFQNLNDVIVCINEGKINCKDWLVG
jgi:hypothetical protein